MNADKCMWWIQENFSIDVGEGALIRSVLDYTEEHLSPGERDEFLLELLDPIGLKQEDLDQMRAKGIY